MPVLSHVDLADQPVISVKDILKYDARTHEITLTEGAFERIAALEVPVRGRSFMVCIDRHPVFWGAFWTPVSSMSFDGVTIQKPLGPHDAESIKLELGYPSQSFYSGEDPRNSDEVMESLEKAGKLINRNSAASAGKLRHSLKGYELYSWMDSGQWRFTLITGTNRNKTLEEITAGANIVPADGWVRISVVGVDAINSVLNRLPQDADVFWLAGPMQERSPGDSIRLQIPPESVTGIIREHALRCKLNLVIQR
jgi:hypothetical protein